MGRFEWGLIAAVGLLILVDAFTRVLPTSPSARTANAYDYVAPDNVVVDVPPADAVPGGFEIFGVSRASLAAAQAQQQAAVPQGGVKALYQDGQRLRLEGLFTRGGERFAVIVKDDGRGRIVKRQTVGLGESLLDFSVVAFGRLSLMLQHPEQDEPLELLMFKPKAK